MTHSREEVEKAYKRNQGAKAKRNRMVAQDIKLIYEAYEELATWAASQPCQCKNSSAPCLPCLMMLKESTGRQCAACDHWDGNYCPVTERSDAMGYCGFWKEAVEPEPEPDGRTLFGHRVRHNPPIDGGPPFVADSLCESCAWHDLDNLACLNDLNGNTEQVPNWTCEFWQGQHGLHS